MSALTHRRLIILGSGPAGYSAARLRGTRQPQAPAHYRHRAGRPAHDHHRRGQLAWRCRGPAGAGPDGAHAPHAERFATEIVADQIHTVRLGARPLRTGGRQGRLQLRRADHRHGRLGAVPRAPFGGNLSRTRRVGMRHLRRLLLPRPARGRDRRRQYGRGRGAVPDQHRHRTSRWCTGAIACARRRSCRIGCSSANRPARSRSCGITRSSEITRRRAGRERPAPEGRPAAPAGSSRSQACSSPSATCPILRYSPASWT